MSARVTLLISPVSAPATEKERLENEVFPKEGGGAERARVMWTRSGDVEKSIFEDEFFDKIVAIGSLFDHPQTFFYKIQNLLKPGGILEVVETLTSSPLGGGNIRSEEELKEVLLLSGFMVNDVIRLGEQNAENIVPCRVISRKPNIEIGTTNMLKTRKVQKEITSPSSSSSSPFAASSSASVWSIDDDDATADLPVVISTNNDDNNDDNIWSFDSKLQSKIIDEESLLEEEDRLVVSNLPVGDCEISKEGKRGACKNCTCGRADALKNAPSSIVSTDITSSCGNCYLGDAFRCSTCPFLGKPAFKPGDRVVIDLS